MLILALMPLLGVSINVNFDMISPLRGQRKMPSERSSADTMYLIAADNSDGLKTG